MAETVQQSLHSEDLKPSSKNAISTRKILSLNLGLIFRNFLHNAHNSVRELLYILQKPHGEKHGIIFHVSICRRMPNP